MRLEITRRADLALRAMVELAGAPSRLKGAELADRLGTTVGFVPQVVAPLVRRGWVRSDPGPTGGYSASIPLGELSVLDVIEAVDGPTDAGRCVVEDRPCGAGPACVLHVAWGKARAQLVGSLGTTSLQTLVPEPTS